MAQGKNILADFQKRRYLENLRSLSTFQQEKTRTYASLVLTLLTLSFFGLFAINPTIATIVELRRKLADSKIVVAGLSEKISNLGMLRQQYDSMSQELPAVLAAVPEDPQAPAFLGKLQALGQTHDVTIDTLEIIEVPLGRTTLQKGKPASYTFTLDAMGSYDQLLAFFRSLATFDRIVSVTSFSMSRATTGDGANRMLHIEGKAYYLP